MSRPKKRAASICFEEDDDGDAAYEEEKRAREAAEMRKRGSRARIRTYSTKGGKSASGVRVYDHTHPEAVEERRQEGLAKARAAREAKLAQTQAIKQSQMQQLQQYSHPLQQEERQPELQTQQSREEEAMERAKARAGLEAAEMRLEEAPPPPPSDDVQHRVIDLLASFVTRNGIQFEALARERKAGDPFFRFLEDNGSEEAVYYKWKREELRKQQEVEDYCRMRAATSVKLGLAGGVRKRLPKQKRQRFFGAVPEKEEEMFKARMRDLSSAGGNAEKIVLSTLPEPSEQTISEDNKGRKMMEKLGWTDGSGLGSSGSGILQPVDAGSVKTNALGVGADNPAEMRDDDDLFSVYQKKMAAAYRNRPNPFQ